MPSTTKYSVPLRCSSFAMKMNWDVMHLTIGRPRACRRVTDSASHWCLVGRGGGVEWLRPQAARTMVARCSAAMLALDGARVRKSLAVLTLTDVAASAPPTGTLRRFLPRQPLPNEGRLAE